MFEFIFDEENRIVKLKGRVGGKASIDFYRRTKEIIDTTRGDLIIDFSETKFIDSSGLGGLVAINTTMLKNKRILSLRNVSGDLGELLKQTNLDKAIKII